MAAALGGLLFWLEKDVTISVDNQEIKTYTFKQTVGEVLAQKNIELGPRDLVNPQVIPDWRREPILPYQSL